MVLSASRLTVGESRTEVVFDDIARTQIVMYAGASGDYNPIHTDEVYATQVAGYPTVVVHGMLGMAAAGKLLTDWAGSGRLARYGARFLRPVWPGDTLTVTATVMAVRHEDGQDLADFSVTTLNQDGERVLDGYATARLGP